MATAASMTMGAAIAAIKPKPTYPTTFPTSPVPKEKKNYTPEELEEIDKKRAQVMYAIASNDKLFWQYYGNDEYSLAFQKELYLLSIRIGTGKVGRIVGYVGFGFMACSYFFLWVQVYWGLWLSLPKKAATTSEGLYQNHLNSSDN